MIRLINQFFTCPHRSHPLFYIVPNGIEIRCKWCREKHFIGRSHFEQAWHEVDIAERATKPLHVVHG